jgi:hypothetical protein
MIGTMRLLIIVIAGLSLALAQPLVAVAAPSTSNVQFTYEVAHRGDVEADVAAFAATVTSILDDDRGWTRAGVELQRVSSGGDFAVVLASPEEVDAAHEVCSPEWSCRVGDQVLINDVRWRDGTDAWTATLAEYRQYLTNHEVGHWLGLGHYDCPGAGEPAAVMQQQSIDMQGCEPNGWPRYWELEAVAGLHGTAVAEPPVEPEGARRVSVADPPCTGDDPAPRTVRPPTAPWAACW